MLVSFYAGDEYVYIYIHHSLSLRGIGGGGENKMTAGEVKKFGATQK